MANVVNFVFRPRRDKFNPMARDKSRLSRTVPATQESASATPWDDWELDADFFGALSRWTIDNPESSLDRVLANVCTVIDRAENFFEVIPDSPFPARGLVKALAHLIKLGATIAVAKSEVQGFAKDIIGWVSDVKSSFNAAGNGDFTRTTWNNLTKMRDLIDEICRWATTRLLDDRWSLSQLTVQREIADFKTRINEAREIFRDRSIICIFGGIDAMLQKLRTLIVGQDAITLALGKLKDTQEAHLKNIIDVLEVQEQARARQQYLNSTLSPHVVANPTYVHQGKSPCDDDTRVDILADVKAWINDLSESSQNFLWLSGDPGCGKSAITATITRQCKDEDQLWAQFFINRNNLNTINPNTYFPSIARQLADKSEAVERQIYGALKQRPSLVDSPRAAAELFISAVGAASKIHPTKPMVIVIDGLDETDRRRLEDIATIFSTLFKALPSYHNAKIFISSRTDDEIQKPFRKAMDVENVKHIHLYTSEESSIRDVSNFLRRRLRQIAEKNNLDPDVWPGNRSLERLTLGAAGLFIWAVTVVKFFQAQLDRWGRERLKDVLDRLTSEGMKDINKLYTVVLELTYDKDTDKWAFETFRRVVGAIVVVREPLSLGDLAAMLNVRERPDSEPVDMELFVRRLRTVLVAGTDEIDQTTTPRLHKSFVEFITGDNAEQQFRVDSGVAHSEVTLQCLWHLSDAYIALNTRSGYPLSGHLRYALRFCTSHLLPRDGVTIGIIVDSEPTIDLPDLNSFIRLSSDENSTGPIGIGISKDGSQIFTSFDNHHDVDTWDAASGQLVPSESAPIAVLEGHNSAVTSVSFSPDGSQIVSGSWDRTIRLWTTGTYQPVASLEGHTHRVNIVCFSPDGKCIASGSGDKTIRIWDTKTGQNIGTPLVGHTSPVISVAFSPNGRYIVSGSCNERFGVASGPHDRTIRLWDVQKLKPLRSPLIRHTDTVENVAFSSDGTQILSSSDDTIHRWDLHTGQLIGSLLVGHATSTGRRTAFSKDFSHVVACAEDGTISLWDARTAQPIGKPWVGNTSTVRSVAFSPSGCHVLSNSHDMSLRLWDVQSGQVVATFTGYTYAQLSLAFSPDGKQVVSGGSLDGTIRIWNIPFSFVGHTKTEFTSFSRSGKLVLSGHPGHIVRLRNTTTTEIGVKELSLEGKVSLRFVEFSPDESCIAGTSDEGILYLWDTATRSLLGSSPPGSIVNAASISFTTDGKDIIVSYNDRRPDTVWSVRDGRLIHLPDVLQPQPRVHNSTSFDVTQVAHIDGAAAAITSRLRHVRWYPRRETDTGFWAYVNNHIIRGNDDGSFVIVPVSRGNVT
ncbi:hypothetical protein FPV67DRAFT_1760709 [Lyophyllum atratum]|nr:hypothetical protein FPV67DRAFT_1760709 [Lyophyllum atratum]